jgi:hypothetical protein
MSADGSLNPVSALTRDFEDWSSQRWNNSVKNRSSDPHNEHHVVWATARVSLVEVSELSGLARQNACVGTDAFVRPASEASVRTIPVAVKPRRFVEERRFSAAMRQEKTRALAPARTRAGE